MTLISHNRSIVVYLTVVMSEHTRYDTPFNSLPIRESHFLVIFLCKLNSSFSEMVELLQFDDALQFQICSWSLAQDF